MTHYSLRRQMPDRHKRGRQDFLSASFMPFIRKWVIALLIDFYSGNDKLK